MVLVIVIIIKMFTTRIFSELLVNGGPLVSSSESMIRLMTGEAGD